MDFKKDKEGKFICPNCGKPMNKVTQTQYDDITWEWDDEDKRYVKKDSGSAEHCHCGECDTDLGYDIGEMLGY